MTIVNNEFAVIVDGMVDIIGTRSQCEAYIAEMADYLGCTAGMKIYAVDFNERLEVNV